MLAEMLIFKFALFCLLSALRRNGIEENSREPWQDLDSELANIEIHEERKRQWWRLSEHARVIPPH